MAERDVQDFDPQQCPGQQVAYIAAELFPLVARAPRVRDSQLQSSILSTCLSPLHDKTTAYANIHDATHSHVRPWPRSRALSSEIAPPGQILETGSQMTTTPGWSNWQFLGGFNAFSDGRVRENGSTADQYITDQSDNVIYYTGDHAPGQGGNSPFTQGNDVQFPFPILFCLACHGQSPPVSLQQSEHTLGVSSVSRLPRHAAPILEGLEFTVLQHVPETGSPKGANQGGRDFKKWLCSCGKSYGRSQDLRRHITDKHQTPHKCPFCDTHWTRAEKIRRHLTTKHQDRFTEEELRQIRCLKSRKDTIRFLVQCRMSTLPGSDIPDARGAGLSLADVLEPLGIALAGGDDELTTIRRETDDLWSLYCI